MWQIIVWLVFISFPLWALLPIRKAGPTAKSLLSKSDTDVWKGVATFGVILAHLGRMLTDSGARGGILLKAYEETGGMGVLLFFFLSGYGLGKGYLHRKPGIDFWKKRLINMLSPYMLIKIIFAIGSMMLDSNYKLSWMLFLSDWFIDVIMITYIIFWLACTVSNGRFVWIFVLTVTMSMIAALIFWKLGFAPRWYNGLLLFPAGMVIAEKETAFIDWCKRLYLFKILLFTSVFLTLGYLFRLFKPMSDQYLFLNFFKTLSGICMCMLLCILNCRLKDRSGIMEIIGKRSLYYYIVHLSLMTILENYDGLDVYRKVVVILLGTTAIVEELFQIYEFSGSSGMSVVR